MGGGSGGGGTTTTSTEAQFPPEFRPLAKSAVKEIQGLQGALPLSQFATPAPQGTAGISPFQQATLNEIPFMLAPSPALQTLQGLTQPFGQLAQFATNAGAPTAGAQAALAGLGVPIAPMVPPALTLPVTPTQTNILGGPTLPGTLAAQLHAPIPTETPILTPPPLGPPGVAPAASAQPSPAQSPGQQPSFSDLGLWMNHAGLVGTGAFGIHPVTGQPYQYPG